MVGNMLYLGDLLSEAKQENYAHQWGFNNFDEWLKSSGLEVGRSTAYYLIKIVNKSRELGIPREQLLKSKISHLKEIFSLPIERGEEIKQLVSNSPEMSLGEVSEAVANVRVEQGLERMVWRNFRVTEDAAREIIDPAIERCKSEHGSTVDSSTGEIVDISDGKALMLICADFLSAPDLMHHEIEQLND